MSGVESQCRCVLECISLPFHLHPSLTAFCFPFSVPSLPPSRSLSLSLSLFTFCLLSFPHFLTVFSPLCWLNFSFKHSVLCLFPLFPIFANSLAWTGDTVTLGNLIMLVLQDCVIIVNVKNYLHGWFGVWAFFFFFPCNGWQLCKVGHFSGELLIIFCCPRWLQTFYSHFHHLSFPSLPLWLWLSLSSPLSR